MFCCFEGVLLPQTSAFVPREIRNATAQYSQVGSNNLGTQKMPRAILKLMGFFPGFVRQVILFELIIRLLQGPNLCFPPRPPHLLCQHSGI